MKRIFNIAVALAAIATLCCASASAQVTNPVKLYKGVVNEATTGSPVQGGGRILVYQGSGTEIINRSRINPATGAYQLVLNPSTPYRLVFLSPRYHTAEAAVLTPEGGNYEETVQDFKMAPIVMGETVYSGRLFAPNSSEIMTTPDLQKIVRLILVDRSMIVTFVVKADGEFGKKPVVAPPVTVKTKTKTPKNQKVKKGATTPSTVTPPDAPAVAPPSDDPRNSAEAQIRKLVDARVNAFKAFFKGQGVSLAQAVVKGDDSAAVATTAPNVIGKVSGLDMDVDYENVEN